MNKFPTLSFLNTGFKYIFNITYKEAFKEVGNKILFLLFYDPWSPDIFKAGKNFMKKYQFLFRYESKTIGYLNYDIDNEEKSDKDKKKRNNNNDSFNLSREQIIGLSILGVLLIGIVVGLLFGKKIWDKTRKKRANELVDDDYDYNAEGNEKIIN